uniref:Zinc finger protein n=1 Tax=Caenorhabditis tropicalis TaxID=1561998 RepID=A0A1I7ULR9_9PELO
MSVAGWFIIPPPPPPSTSSSSFFSSESLLLHHKKRRLQYTPETTVTSSTRKPYSYKDRKHKNAQERREIKKKLFMDLGIIRTNCGIDNEEKDREEAMKRKVTETIVTTYCELCEQNFSSSKMLLLHRAKVHKTPFIECHLCLKLFSQTIQFNRHMKTHYGPNAMRFVQCEHCDRQFKDKEALKTHWKVSHPTTSAFINVHFS